MTSVNFLHRRPGPLPGRFSFASAAAAAVLLAALSTGWLAGCGYTLQNSRNSELSSLGIRRVFVAPVLNDTYQSGIEILLYNEVVRTLGAEGMVVLAESLETADAVLKVRVRTAGTSVLANTAAKYLFPSGAGVGVEGPTNRVVATLYQANLAADFTLQRRNPEPRQSSIVWTGLLSRNKAFPATNQLGAMGSTSALINESEFDRALQELAASLAVEAHANMMHRF